MTEAARSIPPTDAGERWRSLATTLALALTIGLLVVAAGTVARFREAGAEPARARVSRPVPLTLGRESMFVNVNVGDFGTARALLSNRWPRRGHAPVQLAWPLTWRENPGDDAYFRFQFYGLQPTANLLWAYRRTNDRRYLDRLLAILRSYVAYDRTRRYDRLTFDNPHPAAFRAMVLVNTYVKLARTGDLPPDLAAGMRRSLAKLGDFLAYHYHAFESWVNHGFNEAAALMLIAENFPQFPHAAKWRPLAAERLRRMLELNIDRDGVDIENSPFYHVYVLGLVAQITAWVEQYAPSLAADYRRATRRMLRYAGLVTLPDGRLPMLGATAQTHVPGLDPHIYAGLQKLDPWFAYAYSDGRRGRPPPQGTVLFPESGLFVIRSSRPGRRTGQATATFDAGAYRTEHSDLDALSLTLFAGGLSVLPDSGLYTYLDGVERSYYHGTRAHNTVVVDGRDQRRGNAVAGAHGGLAHGGWAHGTSRLYGGVRHDRTVAVLDPNLTLVVDALASERPHSYAQTWHLAPGTRLARGGERRLRAWNASGRAVLQIAQGGSDGARPAIVEGGRRPMQGWISHAYGVQQPAPAVEYRTTARDTVFVTALATGAAAATPVRMQMSPTSAGWRVVVCAGGRLHTVVVPRVASQRNPVGADVARC